MEEKYICAWAQRRKVAMIHKIAGVSLSTWNALFGWILDKFIHNIWFPTEINNAMHLKKL